MGVVAVEGRTTPGAASQLQWRLRTHSCNTSGQRNDCGYVGIDQQQCEAKGCCWDAVNPNPGNLPWCFYSNGLIEGYELSSFNKSSTGGSGTLKLDVNKSFSITWSS